MTQTHVLSQPRSVTDAKTRCSGGNYSSLRKTTRPYPSCDRVCTRSQTHSSLNSLRHPHNHNRSRPVSPPILAIPPTDRENSQHRRHFAPGVSQGHRSPRRHCPSHLRRLSQRQFYRRCVRVTLTRCFLHSPPRRWRRSEIERPPPSARTASSPRPHRTPRAHSTSRRTQRESPPFLVPIVTLVVMTATTDTDTDTDTANNLPGPHPRHHLPQHIPHRSLWDRHPRSRLYRSLRRLHPRRRCPRDSPRGHDLVCQPR